MKRLRDPLRFIGNYRLKYVSVGDQMALLTQIRSVFIKELKNRNQLITQK